MYCASAMQDIINPTCVCPFCWVELDELAELAHYAEEDLNRILDPKVNPSYLVVRQYIQMSENPDDACRIVAIEGNRVHYEDQDGIRWSCSYAKAVEARKMELEYAAWCASQAAAEIAAETNIPQHLVW